MSVFIAIRNDIAPDIRIDHGGGEVGTTEILGLFHKKEDAQKLIDDEIANVWKTEAEWIYNLQEERVDPHKHAEWREDYLYYHKYSIEEHAIK